MLALRKIAQKMGRGRARNIETPEEDGPRKSPKWIPYRRKGQKMPEIGVAGRKKSPCGTRVYHVLRFLQGNIMRPDEETTEERSEDYVILD
jgi:hypothetical protein